MGGRAHRRRTDRSAKSGIAAALLRPASRRPGAARLSARDAAAAELVPAAAGADRARRNRAGGRHGRWWSAKSFRAAGAAPLGAWLPVARGGNRTRRRAPAPGHVPHATVRRNDAAMDGAPQADRRWRGVERLTVRSGAARTGFILTALYGWPARALPERAASILLKLPRRVHSVQ